MPYGIRYRIAYYRRSGGLTTIDIRDQAFSSDSITDLRPVHDPLEISFDGDVSNIYAPVLGSGAAITVVATPLSLLPLFTSDPQKFKVQIYNGASGSSLVWQGFVTAEVYTESYNTPASLEAPITIHCNDGIQLLGNIAYRIDSTTYYTGNVTYGEVINNIIAKLALTYTTVYTSNDIIISGGSWTNPFLYTMIANENFIDENGIVMSCRAVLESLFQSMGFSMRFLGDKIYVIDPINLHDTSKGKSYTYPSFGSETSYNQIGGYKNISTKEILWKATGAGMDVVPSKNITVVKFDPYNQSGYNFDFSDSNNWAGAGSFVGQDGNTWYKNLTITFKTWFSNTLQAFGLKEALTDSPSYGLDAGIASAGASASITIPYYNIMQDSDLSIRISAKFYIQTALSGGTAYNIYSTVTKVPIYSYQVKFSIMVGNQYWKGGTTWETGATGNYIQTIQIRDFSISEAAFIGNNSLSIVNDKWMDISKTIPFAYDGSGGYATGAVTVIIYDTWNNSMCLPSDNVAWGKAMTRLFSNFRIELVRTSTGEVIDNNGIETRGNLTANTWGTSEETISLVTSAVAPLGVTTGIEGAGRGILKGISGGPIAQLLRAPSAGPYSSGQLLIQSINSQYSTSRLILNGILDVETLRLEVFYKLIKDSTYLGTKAFYIAGGTYNDRMEQIEAKLIELTDTREAIV